MNRARVRNLFNGDCNFLFYNPELWQPEGGPYGAKAIHRYVARLAGSGVDALLVNPNTRWSGIPQSTWSRFPPVTVAATGVSSPESPRPTLPSPSRRWRVTWT
jgi:hypothetical protein